MVEPCTKCGLLVDVQYGPGLCIHCFTGKTAAQDPAADETKTALQDGGSPAPDGWEKLFVWPWWRKKQNPDPEINPGTGLEKAPADAHGGDGQE